MTKEVDEFLSGLKGEQQDPFVPSEKEEPFKAEDKEESESEDEKEEKPVPYHQDPKVQRFIEKEISKRLESLNVPKAEVKEIVKDNRDKAEELLNRIIGNDTPEKVAAVKDFKEYLNSLEEKGAERGAQKALETLQEQQAAEAREEAEAQEELTTGFETIEETYGVDLLGNTASAKKTRAEFVDFIRRISPKDSNGDVISFPDMTEAFALFQERSAKGVPPPSRAKGLASRSMARSGEASAAPKLSGNSWNDVERVFSKLQD